MGPPINLFASRSLLFFLLAVPATFGQANPHRDVSIEDLVRASGGRLALHARNLRNPESVLSLNASFERQHGSLSRLLVAGAALAHARNTGTSLTTALPYPETSYRGRSGVLGSRHDETFTVEQLLAAAVRDDDPAATDVLIEWLGPALPAFVANLGIGGLRPVSSHGERDRFLLTKIDPLFADVPINAAQRWLRDGDRKAVVPAPFKTDPRRRDDHVQALGGAWDDWYRERRDAAPLRAVADAWVALLRGGALHSEDRSTLGRLLLGVPSAACARDLGLHLAVFGCDARSWRRQVTAGLVETRNGTVVVVAHAVGFASEAEARHLLARLSESAVRRLAPGGWRSERSDGGTAEYLSKPLPRMIRSITLQDDKGGLRTDLDVGETVRLRVATAATLPTVVSVRWRLSDGSSIREARALTPGSFRDEDFSLPLNTPGNHAVEFAVGTQILRVVRFQVRAVKR